MPAGVWHVLSAFEKRARPIIRVRNDGEEVVAEVAFAVPTWGREAACAIEALAPVNALIPIETRVAATAMRQRTPRSPRFGCVTLPSQSAAGGG
jgi:hypothetical protein